jgi:hypothetical protein
MYICVIIIMPRTTKNNSLGLGEEEVVAQQNKLFSGRKRK